MSSNVIRVGTPGGEANAGAAELRTVFKPLWPHIRRAALISLVASLLVLAPSVYMLEVYARVVDTRSHMTLWMLTLMVVLAFVVMEALEWVRGELLHQVGQAADRVVAPRLFSLMFDAMCAACRVGICSPSTTGEPSASSSTRPS